MSDSTQLRTDLSRVTSASATMGQAAVEIVQRRAWDDALLVFLIGPGGVGKSTLGQLLAPRLARQLLDLDQEFSSRFGNIDAFLRREGYGEYKRANSDLAAKMASNAAAPGLMVTSSGFLSFDNPPAVLARNRELVGTGFSVTLLPSDEIEVAATIVARRQVARGLDRDERHADRVFRERFETYRAAGDMLVLSAADPAVIAASVARRLRASP